MQRWQMIIKRFSHTCQATTIVVLFVLLCLPSKSLLKSVAGKFHLTKPNICLRCDFNGGQKVNKCPSNFDDPRIREKVEVIECGFQKPICGITVNITMDQQKVIYAGCYSKKFNRHCFKDQVRQYGPKNTSYCYHTCNDFFCNPYESWLKSESSGFNLFNILG